MENTEKKVDLLLSLHSQFSENQNHHQKTFINLLVAFFALFGVMGYVFLNLTSLKCYFFENDVPPGIPYWGFSNIVFHLVSFISSIVFLFLNVLNLNNGTSFRRDHCINYNIRKEILQSDYSTIFGEAYDPKKAKICDFLPSFHYIIWLMIVVIQSIIVILNTVLLFNKCDYTEVICVSLLFMLPILSLTSLEYYWRKYKSNLKKIFKKQDQSENKESTSF